MKTGYAILIAMGLLTTVASAEENKELKSQTTCPVMGGKINKSVYYDFEGQRIYMCCAGCTKALKKDTKKYIEIMAKRGEKPDTLQTKCPVMGGKINKSVYADHEGERIYMCCAGCDKAFKKNPGKYIKKMKAAGIALDTVPNKNK